MQDPAVSTLPSIQQATLFEQSQNLAQAKTTQLEPNLKSIRQSQSSLQVSIYRKRLNQKASW